VQRPADQRLLILRRPGATEPGHDRVLDLEPERLGVDQQPVHVEQHGLELPVIARHQVLKYFASR